jgi:3D (Asp-Asp-Asp) domain-containing protein
MKYSISFLVILSALLSFSVQAQTHSSHRSTTSMVNKLDHKIKHTLKVTATAYNSLPAQTDKHPNLAAWSDRLIPGMKAIAISRDLLLMGLKRGTKVRISGLKGEYVVLDKMHRRWHRRIDIYMGNNLQAAKNWGRRNVTISW